MHACTQIYIYIYIHVYVFSPRPLLPPRPLLSFSLAPCLSLSLYTSPFPLVFFSRYDIITLPTFVMSFLPHFLLLALRFRPMFLLFVLSSTARALKSKQNKPKPGSDSEGDDVPIASTLNKKVTHKMPIMGSKLYKATTGNSTQSFGSPLKEYLLGEVQSYVSFQELHPLLLCKFPCCLA